MPLGPIKNIIIEITALICYMYVAPLLGRTSQQSVLGSNTIVHMYLDCRFLPISVIAGVDVWKARFLGLVLIWPLRLIISSSGDIGEDNSPSLPV